MSGLKNYICKDLESLVIDYLIGDKKYWKNIYKSALIDIENMAPKYLQSSSEIKIKLVCFHCNERRVIVENDGELNCLNRKNYFCKRHKHIYSADNYISKKLMGTHIINFD